MKWAGLVLGAFFILVSPASAKPHRSDIAAVGQKGGAAFQAKHYAMARDIYEGGLVVARTRAQREGFMFMIARCNQMLGDLGPARTTFAVLATDALNRQVREAARKELAVTDATIKAWPTVPAAPAEAKKPAVSSGSGTGFKRQALKKSGTKPGGAPSRAEKQSPVAASQSSPTAKKGAREPPVPAVIQSHAEAGAKPALSSPSNSSAANLAAGKLPPEPSIEQTVTLNAVLPEPVSSVPAAAISGEMPPPPESSNESGWHTAGIVGLGVGALGLVAGTVLGILAHSQTTAGKAAPVGPSVQANVDSVNALASGALGGWLGGGALAVTGIVLVESF